MEANTIITYLACIFFLLIIGRIFILPLKSIVKLIGNSILGGILIFIVNLIGTMFNFHIGLNIGTAIITGILGIPRSNSFNIFEIFVNKCKKVFIVTYKYYSGMVLVFARSSKNEQTQGLVHTFNQMYYNISNKIRK